MENGRSGRASDAGARRLRSALPDDYPLGLIALYLGTGNRWLLPNLYVLSLLLEVKTVVVRLIFTEPRDGRERVLVGSCSPFALRMALDREKPAYEEAKHRTPIGPIDAVAPAF